MKLTCRGTWSHFGGSSMHKRKYTDEDLDYMEKLREQKLSYRAIGKIFGVSGGAIHNVLKRFNRIPILNEKIPKNYVTIEEYCLEHGENYNAIYWHIKTNKIKSVKVANKVYIPLYDVPKRRGLSEEKIEHILKFKDTNLSLRKIGKIVGCNPQTVKNYRDLLK